jgi:hypothetical protein
MINVHKFQEGQRPYIDLGHKIFDVYENASPDALDQTHTLDFLRDA